MEQLPRGCPPTFNALRLNKAPSKLKDSSKPIHHWYFKLFWETKIKEAIRHDKSTNKLLIETNKGVKTKRWCGWRDSNSHASRH